MLFLELTWTVEAFLVLAVVSVGVVVERAPLTRLQALWVALGMMNY